MIDKFKKTKELRKEQEDKKLEENSNEQPTLLSDLLHLFMKIGIIVAIVVVLFTFVFGLYKNVDVSMAPVVKSGDFVIYYRLDKNYSIGDLLIYEYEGVKQVRRVIAVEGDVVDIDDEKGLTVNGNRQAEPYIYEDTNAYKEGISFPTKVGKGEVFVLGDSRENATDSRIYGAIKIEDTQGMVMCVIKRYEI